MDCAGGLISGFYFWNSASIKSKTRSHWSAMGNMKHQNGINHIAAFISKMKNEGLPSPVIDTYAYYYHKVIKGETGLVYDRDIEPVSPEEIEDFDNLSDMSTPVRCIPQTVRIVLNGGLGTSMGLTGAKSLIEVKKSKSFLDIIIRQAENHAVKLAFMNSFSTDEDTKRALTKLEAVQISRSLFCSTNFPKYFKMIFTGQLAKKSEFGMESPRPR